MLEVGRGVVKDLIGRKSERQLSAERTERNEAHQEERTGSRSASMRGVALDELAQGRLERIDGGRPGRRSEAEELGSERGMC